MRRVGVDVGGILTELMYMDDETRRILVHEVRTARNNPSRATVPGVPVRVCESIAFRGPIAAACGDPRGGSPAVFREGVLDASASLALARDTYGVAFADERTLERNEDLRVELAPRRGGRWLTQSHEGRGMPPSYPPVPAVAKAEPGT